MQQRYMVRPTTERRTRHRASIAQGVKLTYASNALKAKQSEADPDDTG